ncbi:hypothetical protein BSKO_12505 [Bryopsis sp. KO-2023]|nr:hypothetical protein BSKO_12505 [Bryopsis sp. KO-2023]
MTVKLTTEFSFGQDGRKSRGERACLGGDEANVACPRNACEVKIEEETKSEVVPCEEAIIIPSGFEAAESSKGVVPADSESHIADGGGGQRKHKILRKRNTARRPIPIAERPPWRKYC